MCIYNDFECFRFFIDVNSGIIFFVVDYNIDNGVMLLFVILMVVCMDIISKIGILKVEVIIMVCNFRYNVE